MTAAASTISATVASWKAEYAVFSIEFTVLFADVDSVEVLRLDFTVAKTMTPTINRTPDTTSVATSSFNPTAWLVLSSILSPPDCLFALCVKVFNTYNLVYLLTALVYKYYLGIYK